MSDEREVLTSSVLRETDLFSEAIGHFNQMQNLNPLVPGSRLGIGDLSDKLSDNGYGDPENACPFNGFGNERFSPKR